MLKVPKIYTVNIEERINTDNILKYLGLVSPKKQERIKRCHFKEDAWRFLTAELLVLNILKNELKLKESEIIFSENKQGKPELKNHPHIHFNVSHSGDWVVAAFHNEPIGIDIEKIKPMKNMLKIAKRFFSPKEYELILETKASNRPKIFFEIWTLKESYIKAIGKGISYSLQSFSFDISDKNKIKLDDPASNKKWYFQQSNLKSNYRLAICKTSTEKIDINNQVFFFQEILIRHFYII